MPVISCRTLEPRLSRPGSPLRRRGRPSALRAGRHAPSGDCAAAARRACCSRTSRWCRRRSGWRAILRRHGVAHLHAHWAGDDRDPGAGRQRGVRRAVQLHGASLGYRRGQPPAGRRCASASFSRARFDALGAAQLAALSRSPRDAIAVIHMGVASEGEHARARMARAAHHRHARELRRDQGAHVPAPGAAAAAERGVACAARARRWGEERAAVEREIAEQVARAIT